VAPASGQQESPGAADPQVAELLSSRLAAVGERPDDAAAHGDLGLVYEANTLPAEAKSAYQEAVRLDPDEPLWRFHLALVCHELGELQTAMDIYRALDGEGVALPALQQRLGEAQLEAGDLPGAQAAFERLTKMLPRAPQGWVGLGDTHLRQGRTEDAIAALEKGLEIAPGYRAARYLLGTAYLRQGQTEQARRQLTQGTGAIWNRLPDPLSEQVDEYRVSLEHQVQTGLGLLNAGNPEQAVKALERALETHPDNQSLLNNLAAAYLQLRRLDEAHALLERSKELNDLKFSSHLNLSFWALRSGLADEAIEHADAAIERAPERGAPRLARAQALATKGDYDAALDSVAESLARDARNPMAYLFAGDLSVRLDRLEEAAGYYGGAAEVSPTLFPAWVGVVETNRRIGNRAEALRALDEARKLAPRHELVLKLEKDLGLI
jgi:tetratricopeptide (TPR) repeat protein